MTKREVVFNKFGGRCAYCGEPLAPRWHMDHLEPVVRNTRTGQKQYPERDNIDNLVPACAPCNIQKHSNSLEVFRDHIKQFVNSLNLYHNQYKFAKKYGLVQETNKNVIFYFETLK